LDLQSYELTPMDFFLGYIKDIVYSERVESLPDLHQRITVAIVVVPANVLSCVGVKLNFTFTYARLSVVLALKETT
jgi:hypothetical protein